MSGFRIRRLVRTSGRRKCACATATVTSASVVIAIFAMTAFNLHQNRFSLNDFQVHLGDDVALSRFSDDFSSSFCSEYEIETWDPSQVYLLPAKAQVATKSQHEEHFRIIYVPDVFTLDTRGFYLLDNSTLQLVGCHDLLEPAREEAEMVLYRGHVDRHHRRRKESEQDNVVKHVKIPPSAVCNATSSLPELEYTVMEEDNYYVVLKQKGKENLGPHNKPDRNPGPDDPNPDTTYQPDSGRHYKGSVIVNGVLKRTEYDVKEAKKTCSDHYLCRFSLGFNDDGGDVVVRILDNPVTPFMTSSFSTHCHPRVMFWVAVFGGLPLLIVVAVIAFWVWFYCVKLPADGKDRCTCKRHGCTNASKDVTSAAGSRKDESRKLCAGKHPADSTYGSVQ